ncbi:MAG: N-acetyltransferase [Flavobacterium sp. BFFFF2]|nr:MAG: N-acetyltransferase [Flavobacterium sp. BFFFF2]
MELRDNTFARQFEVDHENGRVYIEYALQERNLFLTRVTTPEGFTDDAFVEHFLTQVLQLAEERKLRVFPSSPKIAAFFRKNPKFKNLLPVGIKL